MVDGRNQGGDLVFYAWTSFKALTPEMRTVRIGVPTGRFAVELDVFPLFTRFWPRAAATDLNRKARGGCMQLDTLAYVSWGSSHVSCSILRHAVGSNFFKILFHRHSIRRIQ